MIGRTAAYTGADNILDAFENVCDGNPYFSVWSGKTIITQNNTSDYDKAKSKLEGLLLVLDKSGNTDIITIKCHPPVKNKDVYITDKSPVISTMDVRVCAVGDNMMGAAAFNGTEKPGDMPNAVWYMLKGIKEGIDSQKETNTAIETRLIALEAGGAVGGVADEMDMWDRINGLLDKPVVQHVVSQVMPIITGFLKQNNMIVNGVDNTANHAVKVDTAVNPAQSVESNDPGADVAYLSPEECAVIDSAIDRLSVHTDDVGSALTKLANYADENPQNFKMLLATLK